MLKLDSSYKDHLGTLYDYVVLQNFGFFLSESLGEMYSITKENHKSWLWVLYCYKLFTMVRSDRREEYGGTVQHTLLVLFLIIDKLQK